MMHPKYYLVRASPELVARLEYHDRAGLAGILLEPMHWSRKWSDSPEKLSDRLAQFKLIFLIYLVVEYSDNPEFAKIFGDIDVSTTQFDMWWTVEEYEIDETFEDVEKILNADLLERFKLTNMPLVDRWVSYLKEKADTINHA